jgi:hypothetical protein
VSDLVKPNELDQIEFLSDACLSHTGFTLISVELNSFIFISSIFNFSSFIQYKFYLNNIFELILTLLFKLNKLLFIIIIKLFNLFDICAGSTEITFESSRA